MTRNKCNWTTLCQTIKKIRDQCDGMTPANNFLRRKVDCSGVLSVKRDCLGFDRVLFFLHIDNNTDNARWRLWLLLFFTRVFGKPKEFPKVQLHGVSFMTLLCRRHRWLEGGNFLGNLVQSLIITSRNNCLGCAAGLSNLTLCITWSSIWAFLHKLILFLTCYVASSLHHRQHRTLYISIAVDL